MYIYMYTYIYTNWPPDRISHMLPRFKICTRRMSFATTRTSFLVKRKA